MTIVARGLGRGGASTLVAFGLGKDLVALEQLADIIVGSSVEQISDHIAAFVELSQLADSGALISVTVDRLDSNILSIGVSSSTNSQIITLANVQSLDEGSIAQTMLSLQDEGINVEALIQKISANSSQISSLEVLNEDVSVESGFENSNIESDVNVTIQQIPDRNVNSVSSIKKLNDDISSM